MPPDSTHTNYEGKAHAALEALKTNDFVYLHVEASDEAGHEGDVDLKIRTIENLDKRAIGILFEELQKWDEPVAIAVLPDHPTPCAIRTHTNTPVPFLIYKPGQEPGQRDAFRRVLRTGRKYGILEKDEFIKRIIMKYYSTNKQAPLASLEEAVVKGLAGDKGLYMPVTYPAFGQGYDLRSQKQIIP